MDIGTGLNKKYLTLFIDAIEFIDEAEVAGDSASQKFYRASIISNILSVECSANICIQSMNLPQVLYENVERISIIGKFDYFSHNTFNKIIDRSLNEYSNLKSLVTIRNDYVHPKVEKGVYEYEHGRFQFGNKKSFSLSNDIRVWKKDDAVALLNAHVEFMNYFFNNLCGYSNGQSNYLLTSFEEEISQELIETCISMSDDLIEKIDRYLNIEMTHLNLRKHET